jgi:hypothetical protein
MSESKVMIVRDLKAYYPKLMKPVAPFGTEQFELQVRTEESSEAFKTLTDLGVKGKPQEDGTIAFNLKRKAKNRKGDENGAPDVVDAARKPFDASIIGNGSGVNVKLFTYPYDVQGRKGTGVMLSAVQVTDLVEYKPTNNVDFDAVEDTTVGAEEDF